MKDFIDTVKIDSSVITDCTYILREFALSTTIFAKFEELWTKIGIKDKSLNKDCSEKLKKLGWLIFIIAKVRILQRRGDIVEFAYMIVAVLHILIMNAPQEVTCDLIESKNKLFILFKEDFK